MKRFSLIIALIVLITLPCSAQDSEITPFTMTLHLSAKEIVLPNKLVVTAIITYPKGYHLDKAAIKNNLLRNNVYGIAPFVLSDTKESIKSSEKSIVETLEYFLEPQIPGDFPITLWEIPVLRDDKQQAAKEKIISEIDFVTVSLPKQIQEIDLSFASPLSLSGNLPLEWETSSKNAWFERQAPIVQKVFPWHLILGAILLGIAFYALRKKPLEEKAKEEIPQSIQEYTKATNTLKRITGKNPAREEIKDYVSFLTNALKYRFEEHFNLKATTKTSEEFLAEVQNHQSISKDVVSELQAFLSITDSIKFANYSLSLQESKELEKHAGFILRKL